VSRPDEPEVPGAPSSPVPAEPPTGSASDAAATDAAPGDPERGLRGVVSAILILEAIAILLGVTVIANGGTSAPGWQIGVILAVALAHVLAPVVMRKRLAFWLIFLLQAVLIGCWAIDAAIGITGVVFLVAWLLILFMRREFRRRLAAGTMA